MINYQVNGCFLKTDAVSIRQELNASIQSKVKFLPVITLNLSMFSEYEKQPEIFHWLKEHAYFIPDGISISFLVFKQYFRLISRYAGIDMVHDLFCEHSGYRVAMVGSTPEILDRAVQYFQSEFLQHHVVFSCDGYQSFSDSLFLDLKQAEPDIVLVGLGCPKQDLFLRRLADVLPHGIGIGVGGVFDIWSGHLKRAPKLIRLFGLEWFYRMLKEPQRFGRVARSIKYLFN